MFFKNKTKNQVERIKSKLKKVKAKDSNCNLFGSEKFRYKLNNVVSMKELEEFEKNLGITLPEAFRTFLIKLGNGGAGPYYGIYSLESILYEDENEGNYAKNACCLYPNMSKEYWNELINPLEDDDVSDDDYFLCKSKVYGGILKFGTQGCEYDMYLVITGEYAGRIIYTNAGYKDYPFFFTYEENFLDWYERWLDEILLDYDTSWFGYKMGGDEFYLLDLFNKTYDHRTKIDVLNGFYKFKNISNISYKKLEKIAIENFEIDENITILITEILSNFDINKAEKLIHKLLNSDNEKYIETAKDCICRHKEANVEGFSDEISKLLKSDNEKHVNYAIDILNGYRGNYISQFSDEISKLLESDNEKHVNYAIDILYTYKEDGILEFKDGILNVFYSNKYVESSSKISELICELGLNTYDVFGHWLQSDSKELINCALSGLRNVPYDNSYFETIKNLLLINDKEISQNILKYLGVIEDKRLLLYYKNLWNRNSGYNEILYVENIKLFKDTLSKLNYPLNYFENDSLHTELLTEFNINLSNKNIFEIVNVSCIKNLGQVFIIYFLKDKSKCIASYDFNGNFIFETEIEDTKVPMYFLYDFTNVYLSAFESVGNIDVDGIVLFSYTFILNLDERKLIDMTKSWDNQGMSKRERSLIKLTL